MKWEHSPTLSDFGAGEVSEALERLASVRADWLRYPEVFAVDVGYKFSKISETEEVAKKVLAIRVHLHPKLPPGEVEKEKKFNFSLENPIVKKAVGPFEIDVIQAKYGPFGRPVDAIDVSEADRRGRFDPLVGGVTIGNARGAGGTLGAVVYDETDGSLCILSNWHVLAGNRARRNDPCIQPSTFDGGVSEGDRVARLKRWRIDAHADAALAELTGERMASIGDVLGPQDDDEMPVVRILGIRGPEKGLLGLKVRKFGRTTGATKGVIDGVGMSLTVRFQSVTQTFHDQLHIVPVDTGSPELTGSGDSGSIWLDDYGKAVGLHFAGETSHSLLGDFAVANLMSEVAKSLEFSFTPTYFRSRPSPRATLAADATGINAGGDLAHALEAAARGPGGPQPVPRDIGERLARLERNVEEILAAIGPEPVPRDIGGP